MLKRLIPLMLIVSMTIPTFAFAEVGGTVLNKHHHHVHGRNHHCQWIMQEKEKKLLSLVEKYTPNQKDQWNQAFNERKSLFKQWISPEFKAKREQMWEAKKAERVELRQQLKEGKITKEEFLQKIQGKKQNFYAQMKKHRIAEHELKNAVKNNDSKSAAMWLNELLSQMQKHNQVMKDRMNN